jgi:hypothetical protein
VALAVADLEAVAVPIAIAELIAAAMGSEMFADE